MAGERGMGFSSIQDGLMTLTLLAHAVSHKPRDISKWDRYLIILFCLFLSIVLFPAQESQKQMAPICSDLFAEAGVHLLVLPAWVMSLVGLSGGNIHLSLCTVVVMLSVLNDPKWDCVSG